MNDKTKIEAEAAEAAEVKPEAEVAEAAEAEVTEPEPEPVEVKPIDSSLVGKPVSELTPAELGALASQLSSLTEAIDSRRKIIHDQVKTEEDVKLAAAGKLYAQALGWAKLPKVQLVPSADGTEYTVSYVAKGKKTNGKRAPTEVNGGAITVNKIGIAMGGIMGFRNKDGNEFETLKELIVGDATNNKPGLLQTDGTPEADRCWDISKKGIAASDIVTKYHADEITIIFNDGSEKLVKDAVEDMKAARKAA